MGKRATRIDWINHLLTFIGTCLGVLLAVYLTTVQENHREANRLAVAMENIKAEIEENLEKTEEHLAELDRQTKALDDMRQFIDTSMQLIATKAQIDSFQQKHPDFYVIGEIDTLGDGLFEWHGSMDLNMNRLEVSDIAWQNVQSLGVLHLADFKKSYKLHALYRFQDEVLADTQKPMNILKTAISGQQSAHAIYQSIFRDYHSQIVLIHMFENGLKAFYEDKLESW